MTEAVMVGIRCRSAVMFVALALGFPATAQNAPVDTCIPGPFVLSFANGSSELGEVNTQILNAVLENASECGNFVLIEGYPPTDGPRSLERTRVLAAFRYLEDHGLPSTDIRLRLSDTAWPQPSEAGRERHVQIMFGDYR